MSDQPWEEIEHSADWALRVRGEDLRALYENAARGMIALAGGEADPDQPAVSHDFALSAPDAETLLIDWLTELVYLIEDKSLVISDIRVARIENFSLEATVRGTPGGHFSKHIKAVTYHGLEIIRRDDGYEATIVFDV
ncbi:MAG TPA: archease [Aggregatilineales bacterium]|nr:archease [Chloroflexota bacterium]HOA22614.1 archease [Aggregatilineales bacterium]HPV07758.1 archease [Aggregatilineales bacterium]HQA67601.1 archease [Aggregatilineales bacterium]HQE17126.1 archease [Aggregatilineales bacterium]